MKITLSNLYLDSIDISFKYVENNVPSFYKRFFQLRSGEEHYRLLLFLSKLYKNTVISDIGTNKGASAVALSENESNEVISIDIEDVKDKEWTNKPNNCNFIIADILHDENIFKKVLESKLIFLDIDHLYTNEIRIYKKLIENKWKGVLICDDIHLNLEMKRFWEEVQSKKIDITRYGHYSGTGAIITDDTIFELL